MKTRLLIVLFSLGLIVTACAGADEADAGVASLDGTASAGAPAEGAADAEVNTEEAMLAFAACLRDNGVQIDDPTVDADGNVQFGDLRGAGGDDQEIDRDAIRTAREACQEEIDGVALGFGGRGDLDLTEMEDTFVEYAACMRDNGYDMDDPDLSSFGQGGGEPGQGGGIFGEIDREDPDYLAAQDVCEEILSGAFGDAPVPGTGQGRGGGRG